MSSALEGENHTYSAYAPLPIPAENRSSLSTRAGTREKSGRYLISVPDDKPVRVWDVSTAEVVRVLQGQI